MATTTRRAAIGVAASVIVSTPVLALPAVAGESDPIFVAIENHKRLWDEFGEVIRDERSVLFRGFLFCSLCRPPGDADLEKSAAGDGNRIRDIQLGNL